MVKFDINKRMEFQYTPGMEVAFMNEDLQDKSQGKIVSSNFNYVKMSDGKLINKGLIFALLNEDLQEVYT